MVLFQRIYRVLELFNVHLNILNITNRDFPTVKISDIQRHVKILDRIPTYHLALTLKAYLSSNIQNFKNRHRPLSNDVQIFRCSHIKRRIIVFPKSHIQLPMHTLDRPMLPYCSSKKLYILIRWGNSSSQKYSISSLCSVP